LSTSWNVIFVCLFDTFIGITKLSSGIALFVIISLGSFTTCVLSAIAYTFLPWKLTVLVVPCIENLDNPLKHLLHLTTILPYTLNRFSHFSKVLVIYAGLLASVEN